MDGGAGEVGAGVVGDDLLVGKEPEVEAAEGRGQVRDGAVGVAEAVDPRLGEEGDGVVLEEEGGGVRGGGGIRWAAVQVSKGEAAVLVQGGGGGGGGEGAEGIGGGEEAVGEEGEASMMHFVFCQLVLRGFICFCLNFDF